MPAHEYSHHFELINASEINVFTLPGASMYLNRGLIEAADNKATPATTEGS